MDLLLLENSEIVERVFKVIDRDGDHVANVIMHDRMSEIIGRLSGYKNIESKDVTHLYTMNISYRKHVAEFYQYRDNILVRMKKDGELIGFHSFNISDGDGASGHDDLEAEVKTIKHGKINYNIILFNIKRIPVMGFIIASNGRNFLVDLLMVYDFDVEFCCKNYSGYKVYNIESKNDIVSEIKYNSHTSEVEDFKIKYVDYKSLHLGTDYRYERLMLDYTSSENKVFVYVRNEGVVKLISHPNGHSIVPILTRDFIRFDDIVEDYSYIKYGIMQYIIKDNAYVIDKYNINEVFSDLVAMDIQDVAYANKRIAVKIDSKWYLSNSARLEDLIKNIVNNNSEYSAVYGDSSSLSLIESRIKNDGKEQVARGILYENRYMSLDGIEMEVMENLEGEWVLFYKGHVVNSRPNIVNVKDWYSDGEYMIGKFGDEIHCFNIKTNEVVDIEAVQFNARAIMLYYKYIIFSKAMLVTEVDSKGVFKIYNLLEDNKLKYLLVANERIVSMVERDRIAKSKNGLVSLFFEKKAIKGYKYYHHVSNMVSHPSYYHVILSEDMMYEYEIENEKEVLKETEIIGALNSIKMKRAQDLERNKIEFTDIEELTSILKQLPPNFEFNLTLSKSVGNCKTGTLLWASSVFGREVDENEVITAADILKVIEKRGKEIKDKLMSPYFKNVVNLAVNLNRFDS